MKAAIIGYGKMGHEIEKILLQRGHTVALIIDQNNTDDLCAEKLADVDVAIEFTTPWTAYDNYLKAWKAGVKVVSGSTGWMKEHGDDVRKACQDGKTLFWASNFSVGVAIFGAVNTYLAKIMNRFEQYDVNLVETHHVHKLDAPSGTAITLAEQIVDNLDRKERWGLHETKEGVLRIDDIRRKEVPGIHTITYDSPEDMITITHDAHGRKGFALGAVIAAEYTAQHSGLLTMEDLFQF